MWSLNLTNDVENNSTFITIEFVHLKLKNTSVGIDDQAVETSPVSVVADVDQCGF